MGDNVGERAKMHVAVQIRDNERVLRYEDILVGINKMQKHLDTLASSIAAMQRGWGFEDPAKNYDTLFN